MELFFFIVPIVCSWLEFSVPPSPRYAGDNKEIQSAHCHAIPPVPRSPCNLPPFHLSESSYAWSLCYVRDF